MGYCFGTGYNIGGYWWFGHLIFWGIVLLGIFFLLRNNIRHPENRALDILEKEYALGRITREEFLNKKKDLK